MMAYPDRLHQHSEPPNLLEELGGDQMVVVVASDSQSPVGIGVEFLSSSSTRLGMVTAIASCRVSAGYTRRRLCPSRWGQLLASPTGPPVIMLNEC